MRKRQFSDKVLPDYELEEMLHVLKEAEAIHEEKRTSVKLTMPKFTISYSSDYFDDFMKGLNVTQIFDPKEREDFNGLFETVSDLLRAPLRHGL